jgi:hypothetical protein
MTQTVLVLTAATTGAAAGGLGITGHIADHLKLGPPDVFPLPNEPFPIVIGVSAADRVGFADAALVQRKSPKLPVGIDLAVRQQTTDIILVLSTDLQSTLPFSITPQQITMYTGDTGPTLRFQVVDDGTGTPLDLTGATIQFLVKRSGATTLAIPSALSACTSLPNPTQLEQAVTGSGSGQSVIVDTTAGTGLVNNGPMNVGVPSAANYETIASVGTPDGTHLFGIFAKNHLPGEPVVEVAVSSPDPVYNARGGYCLYAWPEGAPNVPATYQGQLKITFASGVIEHTAILTIVVTEGF